jgi:hypothetical protein
VRRRAEFYYQQLDALRLLRREVRRELLEESKKHKAWKLLCQIPSIGPIRAAVLIGILQTPHRFRTKRQPEMALETLGFESESQLISRQDVPWTLRLTADPSPSRTTRQSHRLRVSNRTTWLAPTTRTACQFQTECVVTAKDKTLGWKIKSFGRVARIARSSARQGRSNPSSITWAGESENHPQ